MTRKIGFIVVSSSGHEDNFSATELMVHAPSVSGWRSTRLCSYPQQITIQLVERCRVRKLQLLAHQYLIPTKVEFHIGDTLPDASTPGLAGHFRRLGYVCLSDNEKTGFKARELKSIHVDAIGLYLRITFHRNHVNRYNLYNQVLLYMCVCVCVCVCVICPSVYPQPSREQLIEHYLNTTQLDATLDTTYMGKCESISPLDDLAFDMYQDPEVAHIIRLLDQRKQDMVRQEKFELAKSLKQAIADLQKVGEHLARYDVEKRCAIEKEDYDLAKRKKEQMEEYRKTVYQQLEVHNLLDMTAESSSTKDPPSLLPSPGHHSVVTKPHISSETNRRGRKSNLPQEPVPEPVTVTPKPTNQSATPCSHACFQVNSVPYDERPLPTLQRKDRPEEATPSPAEEHSDTQGSPYSSRTPGELEPLTEKAQREASLPIEVYGDGLVAGAYSKSWSHREDALLAVYKKLMEVLPATPKEELRKIIRAAVFLVKRGLPDKVSSVFQASLKLLRLLLSQLIPGLGLGRAEVAHCLEQTWPNLLARTGDSSSRIRATATAFIQEIAALKEVRVLQVIPSELVKPFKSNFPTRLAQSRTELLEKLLADLGTESSGFTLDNVMTFCTGALEHNASVVRELAVRIVLSMYQQHRNAVLSFLPANDAATRKNILYKNLFDSFARIDGRLVETQTQKKRDGQQDGQQEKEEIRSLQEQLAALKEISVGGAVNAKNLCFCCYTVGISFNALFALCIFLYFSLCIFCGKKDESFTEDGLDLHYWKHCPMLRRCDECRQVVEIASLTEHLLGECESRSKFSQCPRCSEAVATDDLARHTQGPACNLHVFEQMNHCSVNHKSINPICSCVLPWYFKLTKWLL
uniref:Centrosomal protein of 104 kDa n=1 Tax=Myripristis murdjan TaxID=586833 RepID=A0A668AZ19_9TELE